MDMFPSPDEDTSKMDVEELRDYYLGLHDREIFLKWVGDRDPDEAMNEDNRAAAAELASVDEEVGFGRRRLRL